MSLREASTGVLSGGLDSPPSGLRGGRSYQRRGTVLILVVGVLVLLAISATVYVGIGRLERTASIADETRFHRSQVANKVVDHIGRILAEDMFALNAVESRRSGEPVYTPFASGETWDYPLTLPLDSQGLLVQDQADPLLAATEPEPIGGGRFDWPKISNVHPEGRFVDLGHIFDEENMFESVMWIGGNNPPPPYELDTYALASASGFEVDLLDYGHQIDEADPVSNGGFEGFVDFADQRYGTDADGDGRYDARWTELLDLYGMPQGMRVFIAPRVIDASSLLNLNSHIELGLTASVNDAQAGSGATPADVDLYGALWRSYEDLPNIFGGSAVENEFVSNGFRNHLLALGYGELDPLMFRSYTPSNRLTALNRTKAYELLGHLPYHSAANLRPYGLDVEYDLRMWNGVANTQTISAFGENFADMDSISPLRGVAAPELDLANEGYLTADFLIGSPAMVGDIRHLLTTYNGSMPIRPWTGSGAPGSVGLRPNINALLEAEDLQAITGGFFWALAPYAAGIDISGTGAGPYIHPYGFSPSFSRADIDRTAQWWPLNQQPAYGDREASYALLKSATLAVNALDTYDAGMGAAEQPTVRYLVFDGERPTRPSYAEEREINGVFDHGTVSLVAPGEAFQTTVRGRSINLIGLERQPFLREVATYVMYEDGAGIRNPNGEFLDEARDAKSRLITVEIGNPWDEELRVQNYQLKFGSLPPAILPGTTISAGGTAVYYFLDGPDTAFGGRVLDQLKTRGGGAAFHQVIHLLPVEPVVMEPALKVVSLWRTDVNLPGAAPGSLRPNVPIMVDRLYAGQDSTGTAPDLQVNGSYDELQLPPGETAYAAVSWSMRRDCRAIDGFPGYVFHSPEYISPGNGVSSSETDPSNNAFWEAEGSTPGSNFFALPDAAPDGYINDSNQAKGYMLVRSVPRFQFHVNAREVINNVSIEKPFQSPAELLLLTSVCHLNVPQYGADDLDPFRTISDDAAIAGVDPRAPDVSRWITVSELLGDTQLASRGLFQDPASGDTLEDIIRPANAVEGEYPPDFRFMSGAPNPFCGKLDYTRFIPRDDNGQPLPEMAVPLAARVLDAFETMDVDVASPLVQGRININTAPRRVLEALPYLLTQHPVNGMMLNDSLIADVIEAYRDRQQRPDRPALFDDFGQLPRSIVTNVVTEASTVGLRDDLTSNAGFVSLGELLLLGRWAPVLDVGGSLKPDPAIDERQSMSRLAIDGMELSFDPLNPWPTEYGQTGGPNYDPTDDIAERIALVRAINNSVSLRSDVFFAYIRIAGFTQGDIDAARAATDDSNDQMELLRALKASVDQRYIVAFDRSNVRRRTDRPRLLFALKEVPAL